MWYYTLEHSESQGPYYMETMWRYGSPDISSEKRLTATEIFKILHPSKPLLEDTLDVIRVEDNGVKDLSDFLLHGRRFTLVDGVYLEHKRESINNGQGENPWHYYTEEVSEKVAVILKKLRKRS